MNELPNSKLMLENSIPLEQNTELKTPPDLARLNEAMTQAGQAANQQAARVAFEDHTARKADNTIRRKIADLALFETFLQSAGVHGNKTTHSLRHTAITSAIRHGAPAEKVRGMSRHASLDTLMIYYHETDRIDDPAEKYISYE